MLSPELMGERDLGSSDEEAVAGRHRHRRLRDQMSVSWQPIPPARFYLRDDDELAPPDTYTSPSTLPPLLKLDEFARCANCGTTIAEIADNERQNIRISPCTIFASEGIYLRKIERLRCGCRKSGDVFTIGPDLGQIQLFNYDNKCLVTHDIVDRYMTHVVQHETPVNAFYQALLHQSRNNGFMHVNIENDLGITML